MSTGPVPSFYNSPYFVEEIGNWHLTPDAPEEVKKEFEEYMREEEQIHEEVFGEYDEYIRKLSKNIRKENQ